MEEAEHYEEGIEYFKALKKIEEKTKEIQQEKREVEETEEEEYLKEIMGDEEQD